MNGCFYFVIVESMEAQVLKLRHSLIGKSIIPVILRVKGFEDELQGERMARLKKDHCLTQYSMEELGIQFAGLTGETLGDILTVRIYNLL